MNDQKLLITSLELVETLLTLLSRENLSNKQMSLVSESIKTIRRLLRTA